MSKTPIIGNHNNKYDFSQKYSQYKYTPDNSSSNSVQYSDNINHYPKQLNNNQEYQSNYQRNNNMNNTNNIENYQVNQQFNYDPNNQYNENEFNYDDNTHQHQRNDVNYNDRNNNDLSLENVENNNSKNTYYLNNNSDKIKQIQNFNINHEGISNNIGVNQNQKVNNYNTSNYKLSLRLEHAMGYNGTVPNSTIIHPNLKNYIYIAGSVIVVAEMNDASKQLFLRGHDDEVTSIALSHNGDILASGQKGNNSDIIVWDFNSGKIMYKLSEHDFRIEILKFSQDDKLLFSSGNTEDKKQFIWDVSTGYIVSNCPTYPTKTVAMAWGYKIRDNRGSLTDLYQFATCGGFTVSLWALDPYKGIMEYEQIQTGNFSREYISLAFSINEQKFLYAGTSSGDVVCFLVKNKLIVFSKIICARGITSIIPLSKNQIVIGGGDGTLTLTYVDEPKCEILANVQLFGAIYSLSPSEDGVQLLAATDKGFIYRVRAADLTYILLNENHTDGVIKMDQIHIHDLKYNNYNYSNNNPEYRKQFLNQQITSLNETRFGTTSLDGTIRLWDLSDYSVYFRLFLNPNLTPTCLYFTDECLFSGWSDGKLRNHQISNSKGKINFYLRTLDN